MVCWITIPSMTTWWCPSCSIFTHPLLDFSIGSSVQPKQACHGGGEDWVCGRSRGEAHGVVDGVTQEEQRRCAMERANDG